MITQRYFEMNKIQNPLLTRPIAPELICNKILLISVSKEVTTVDTKAKSGTGFPSWQTYHYKMSLGAICSGAILALLTTTIFPLVSADDYNKRWGDNVGGKGLDNQFIVGNWRRRDKEQNHLSAQFISGREKLDFS